MKPKKKGLHLGKPAIFTGFTRCSGFIIRSACKRKGPVLTLRSKMHTIWGYIPKGGMAQCPPSVYVTDPTCRHRPNNNRFFAASNKAIAQLLISVDCVLARKGLSRATIRTRSVTIGRVIVRPRVCIRHLLQHVAEM